MEHTKTRGLWAVTVRDYAGKTPELLTQPKQQPKTKTERKRSDNGERRK